MIISASYKTDIPAFYADWLMARLRAGFCRMTNPWGGQTYDVPLTPETVDGFVLWTRNIGPLAGRLDAVAAVAPFTVQYTITGYPRALETSTIPTGRAIADIRRLRQDFGPRAVVWRYDPILFTSLTPARWHRETFARLARALQGAVDEVVISFAHIYRKTQRNLDAAAGRAGFTWEDPAAPEKQALAAALAGIAQDAGMAFRVCAQADYVPPGGALARCIDAARLSDIAGRPIAASVKGNRADCLCHESRDIGAYDTCPHGCCYCYAVNAPATAKRRHAAHDPDGPFLFPPARAGVSGQASAASRMPENIQR
jgi:Domain of unknown function (DUF1848)